MPHYLIVGAGVFGLSTAYYLLLDGEKDVTILDRSVILPAPDAASTDINRIVRSSYGEPLYTKLGQEAIELWKKDFPGIYRESGLMVLGNAGYVAASQANDIAIGSTVTLIPNGAAIRNVIPDHIPLGSLIGSPISGYITPNGGWADAEAGMKALLQKVVDLGGRVLAGNRVNSLIIDEMTNVVGGVQVNGGEEIEADVTILATGSWTASLLPQSRFGLSDKLTATGQSIAAIQLDEVEAGKYKDIPVTFNIDTGFYVFPPNPDRLMKVAIHGGGHLNFPAATNADSIPRVSTPRTVTDYGQAGLAIPVEMAAELKRNLVAIYPELDRPFCKTRLCWYSDTPDGDWLIDEHPTYKNLIIATGDSGHAYKFLPNLGRLVVQRIRGTLSSEAAQKFAFDRSEDTKLDGSRPMREIKVLNPNELAPVP
ncbi:hypothetical protein FRB94_001163 [Tulasnella sp. JGI-2019a]|nr:hypothetical protein FRB93_000902 [Tulasnella sp. JGI-2019a]KAG9005888.1 hypothetical protein FRB94_001163 [Tulasnella sp. JGI-2019a]KAG9038377.1 hypothetical protein FRB95_001789 [Tulasnella sp. JGI-2019a]